MQGAARRAPRRVGRDVAMGRRRTSPSIRREIDVIQKEIDSAHGISGRLRKLDDQIERTRKAVTHRIRDSIIRIANQSPALGRHLRNAVRTGLLCRYSPENNSYWEL
jgi:hypothetical protein